MKNYALFSVYDKRDVDVLATAFVKAGYLLVATGNTLKLLRDKGLKVIDISELTGEPERFGGRVKTLHHKVQGGILFRPGQDEASGLMTFALARWCAIFILSRKKPKTVRICCRLWTGWISAARLWYALRPKVICMCGV